MRSLENRQGPGRPSVDKDTLSSDRDAFVWLLSVFWGEIGWEIPRSTSSEELRRAFGPVKGHSSEHLLALFMRPTPIAATPKEIRQTRKLLGKAVERLREAQTESNKCEEASRLAESAMLETQSEHEAPMVIDLFKAWGSALKARGELESARASERVIEQALRDKEAGTAQNEVVDYITEAKYARNPMGLGNAMAGLPDMTWQQSYARCAKLPCTQWPNFHFRLFETIKTIWNHRDSYPDLSPVQLFRQEIGKLHKKVLSEFPQLGPSRTMVENVLRSHLSENWRRFRLAVEDVVRPGIDPDRAPFLILSRFSQYLAKPRTPQDQILDAREKISD
jgi:hypothetical protein